MSMSTVCPQCRTRFEAGIQCPQCNFMLSETGAPDRQGVHEVQFDKWHQTPWGRIVASLLLALGLCHALSQLGTTLLGYLDQDGPASLFSPWIGLALFGSIQALVLLLAGAVAGSCQRRGFSFGAAVGLLSGMFIVVGLLNGTLAFYLQPFVSMPLTLGSPIRAAVVYGLPPLHLLCGSLGGLVGSTIWQPPPTLLQGRILRLPSDSLVNKRAMLHLSWNSSGRPLFSWDGPVDALRILAGVLVAICGGIIGTRSVVDFIIAATEGYLKIENRLQDRITLMEVYALSIFLGGCLAGATTPNGLKQGFWVGVGSAILIFSAFLMSTVPPIGSLVFLVLSAMVLGPMGGWFGTELLPFKITARKLKKASWF